MRILFCGGGTAGHIMPAVAMCEMIGKNIKNCEFAFVGRRGGYENRSITSRGYKLYTIDIEGLQRKLSFKNVSAIIKVLKSGRKAKEIISDFNPDIVIGTGGYVCYPIIRAAQRLKIKTLIHESNAYPGLVTRLLGKKCDKLLLNHEITKKYLKKSNNSVVVGNPIRSEFSSMTKKDARQKLGIKNNEFFIVSFGGSLGSEILNNAMIKLMNEYSCHTLKVVHLHACGARYYNGIKEINPNLCMKNKQCSIVPYIDNMPIVLKAADLAITRSGAMTISEITHAKIASLLIPSPNVTANHQYYNAKSLSDVGAAIMIEEKDLSSEALIKIIKELKENDHKRNAMAEKAASVSRTDTEKKVLEEIKNLSRRNLS